MREKGASRKTHCEAKRTDNTRGGRGDEKGSDLGPHRHKRGVDPLLDDHERLVLDDGVDDAGTLQRGDELLWLHRLVHRLGHLLHQPLRHLHGKGGEGDAVWCEGEREPGERGREVWCGTRERERPERERQERV